MNKKNEECINLYKANKTVSLWDDLDEKTKDDFRDRAYI